MLAAAVGVARSEGPWLALMLLALMTLAARFRPWAGVSLGLGTIALPVAVARLGIPAAIGLAVLATIAAMLLDQRRRRRRRHPLIAMPLPLVVTVALTILAATAAGGFAQTQFTGLERLADLTPALVNLAPTAAFGLFGLCSLLTLRWLLMRGMLTGGVVPRGLKTLAPMSLLLDTVGWWLGASLVAIAWANAWPLLIALALLAAAAARLDDARRHVAGQADELERLQQAHHRILSETSGMAGIAAQFLVECGNVLPVDTFQLEVFDQEGLRRSFSAGRDRMLGEGEPALAPVPPMLPGIHKRVDWHTIEHRLHASADEGGGLLGILRLWCDPRRLEPRDEALLASLVPHLASSLHRARLDREAKHDPLTGVLVRRVLERRLQEVYRQSCEEGTPMAVILCDIDHFKKVNDTYGHDAGDQALIAVAQALDRGRRDQDLLCRYGGEEFTVLLEASNGELGLAIAERLREAVASLDVVYEGQRLPLRLSAGVAAFPELHVKTASELLLLADEALYGAKEGGRNRSLLHQGHGRFIDSEGRRYGAISQSRPDVPRVFQ